MMDDIKDDGTAASAGVKDEVAPPAPVPGKADRPLRSVGPESEVRGGAEAPEE